MKVLLSHNMSSVSGYEVYTKRAEYAKKLMEKYEDVEIIDNYNHHMSPDQLEDIKDYSRIDNFLLPIVDYTNSKYSFLSPDFDKDYSIKLWHLGRSIQQIGQADAIYFIPGFSNSRGCKIERLLASIYNIPILTLDKDPKVSKLDIDSLDNEDDILQAIERSLMKEAEEIKAREYQDTIEQITKTQIDKMKIPSFLEDYVDKK